MKSHQVNKTKPEKRTTMGRKMINQFYSELTKQLRQSQDETHLTDAETIQQMVETAGQTANTNKPTTVGVCCENLKGALDSRNYYPMLVFISFSDWQYIRLHPLRYPGATGPGYYRVFDVDDPDLQKGERVTYVPLTYCIFCNTNLEAK